MKKLVIINFDNQYINTSRIITNILNEVFDSLTKKFDFKICDEDVSLNLFNPINLLVNETIDDYLNYQVKEEEIKLVEEKIRERFISESSISNGLEDFIFECEKNNIEVRIITNKNLDAVKECVNKYTPKLVNNVDLYSESYSGLKLIERLLEERNLSFDEVLIISSTDFNDEFLSHYEYSKEYCDVNIFSDYLDLIPVLFDEEIKLPSISGSIDIVVNENIISEVDVFLSKNSIPFKVIDIHSSKEKVIVCNEIEKTCVDGNMYLYSLLEEVIKPFSKLKKELKAFTKECEITLSAVIELSNNKVNPCLSLSKKIIRFLADTNIDIDYDVYCY